MSYFRRTATIVLAVAASAITLSSKSAQALLVDDFSSTAYPWPLALNAIGTTSASETFTDGIAGTRTVTLGIATNPGPRGPSAQIWTPATSPVLEFSEGTFHTASMTLAYTGFSADLSANPVLDISFASYDSPTGQPIALAVSVNGSAPLTADYATSGSGDALLDLSTIAGANLSAVTNLTIAFAPPRGGDFAISQIGTVIPEPTWMGLAGIAGLALNRRRRR